MNIACNEEELEFNGKDEPLRGKQDALDIEDSCPGSTDADSEEDYESHFEAIDELAGILGEPSEEQPNSGNSQGNVFERPSNPVCNDRQFYLPRCEAPVPFFNQMNPVGQMESVYSSGPCSYEAAGPMRNHISMGAAPYGSAHGVFSNRPSSVPY